jgi:hypothetical protein
MDATYSIVKRKLPADGSRAGALIPRPSSTTSRLILDVNPRRCFCGTPAVLDEKALTVCPEQVLTKGVTQTQWMDGMSEFQKSVQAHTTSITAFAFLVISVVGIPYIIIRNNRLQTNALSSLKQFNEEVLEPKGLFIKPQKSVFNPGGRAQVEVAWLSVALTPDEAHSLKGEEHVFAYMPLAGEHWANDSCCKCMNVCCGVPQVI